MQQALLEDNRKLLENKDKLLLASASSVHKFALPPFAFVPMQ